MVEVASIRAVLFARRLDRMTAFYSEVLGLTRHAGDDSHVRLERSGFELIVHQIPAHIADKDDVTRPPVRRVEGAVRLDYPIEDIEASRVAAKSLGGSIDAAPPPWAARDTNFFLGYDPEGNVFGVSQHAM